MIWGSCCYNWNSKFEKNVCFQLLNWTFQLHLWANYYRNLKKINLKNAFSIIGHKMSMGRVPTEIFGVLEFLYRKFVKKHFRGRGPQK